jgi:protein Mpv17
MCACVRMSLLSSSFFSVAIAVTYPIHLSIYLFIIPLIMSTLLSTTKAKTINNIPYTVICNTLKVLWQGYLRQLESQPVRTKAITSGILSALGDLIAQSLEHGFHAQFNAIRTIKFGLYGLIITGPLVHYWYQFLAHIFQRKTDVLTSLLKIVMHQGIFSPLLYVLFFLYTGLFDGNIEHVPKKIKNDLVPLVIAQLKLWPVALLINFQFVPLKFQVLFSNLVALMWNVYFSFLNNLNRRKQMPKSK